MDPAGISVSRTLPIDGALLSDVFLRLRRDSTSPALRWTLGDRGVAEVEVGFTSNGPVWTTAARLWSGSGLAVTAASVRCVATGPDEVRLTLEPTLPPAPAWGHQGRQMLDLVRATVDELAEELLWHATRVGTPQN